jgi:hypothetical protein
MSNTEFLNSLITEGERLTSTVKYVPAPDGVIRLYSVYRSTENEKYQDWLARTQRFIKTSFPSELNELKALLKEISPQDHQKILGILRAIKSLPEEPKKSEKQNKESTNITINNTQTIVLNLFKEAIKDEISGKEYKELKEILKNIEKEPEKTKSRIIEKLKSFGNDVLSNVVANIITNPNIYTGLF